MRNGDQPDHVAGQHGPAPVDPVGEHPGRQPGSAAWRPGRRCRRCRPAPAEPVRSSTSSGTASSAMAPPRSDSDWLLQRRLNSRLRHRLAHRDRAPIAVRVSPVTLRKILTPGNQCNISVLVWHGLRDAVMARPRDAVTARPRDAVTARPRDAVTARPPRRGHGAVGGCGFGKRGNGCEPDPRFCAGGRANGLAWHSAAPSTTGRSVARTLKKRNRKDGHGTPPCRSGRRSRRSACREA